MVQMRLPTSIDVAGQKFDLNTDYRAAIRANIVLSDSTMPDRRRAYSALYILIPGADGIEYGMLNEAYGKLMQYLHGGAEPPTGGKRGPKLVDWEQDFDLIISAMNKMLQRDIREDDHMHWWTFMSYYKELDEKSMFSQVVQIRRKLAAKQKLEKWERKFYDANRNVVDFKNKYTEEEKAKFKELGV